MAKKILASEEGLPARSLPTACAGNSGTKCRRARCQ